MSSRKAHSRILIGHDSKALFSAKKSEGTSSQGSECPKGPKAHSAKTGGGVRYPQHEFGSGENGPFPEFEFDMPLNISSAAQPPTKPSTIRDHSAYYEYRPLINSQSLRLVTILPAKSGMSPRNREYENPYGYKTFEYEDKSLRSPIRKTIRLPGSLSRSAYNRLRKEKETIPLRLTLQISDLNNEILDYEALSYCWGSEGRVRQVECDGKTLMITTNLENALLRIRDTYTPRTVWVDSICINQDDTQERTQQVKIMGKIYTRAVRTLIWLGEEDENTAIAEHAMQHLIRTACILDGAKCEHGSAELTKTIIELADIEESCKKLEIFPPWSREHGALVDLFDRPWFFRAWVFQEVVLSKDIEVICGSVRMPIVLLTAVLHQFEKLQSVAAFWSTDYFEDRYDVRRTLFHTWQDHKDCEGYWERFLSLLHGRRGAQATDQRDLVYSLLGVLGDDDINGIEPDYEIPCEELYILTARKIIAGTRRLRILAEITPDSKQLPSWVPDWGIESLHRHSQLEFEYRRCFSATGSSRVVLSQHPDSRRLALQGLRHSRISLINEPRAGRLADELVSFLTSSCTYKPTGESMHSAFMRTLYMDVTDRHIELFEDGYIDSMRLRKYYWELCQGQTDEFGHEALRRMKNRKLALTSTGHLALVPNTTLANDFVYLLLGGDLPIILRKAENDYLVVGEAFVCGLMNGEGLVEARTFISPDHDLECREWLQNLHKDELPFETEIVVLG